MFFGNEKEHVFPLLPGEEPLDEVTIHHQRLFLVKSGTTRARLTTHRFFYTATRVFSPAYWVLLVVFYPLLFYYFFRLSRNRNVALPLGSIDSFEKRYRPNWLRFVLLAILFNPIIAYIFGVLVEGVMGRPESLESLRAVVVSQFIVQFVVWALLAVGTLMLLLATRIVGYDVRSRGNNSVSIGYSAGDLGISEGRLDAFFQNVQVQMERRKVLQPQAEVGN